MIGIVRLAGLVIAALAAGGCLQVGSVTCKRGGVCPAGLRCGLTGEREVCVAVTCGNGRPDPGEFCDDGNNVSGDGCPADCSRPCGDGILDPGEACDDGNNTDGDTCPSDCDSPGRCGDGVLDPGEACDDGNLQSQDGCSSRCTIEVPAWTTTGAVSDAAFSVMAYDAAHGTAVLFGAPGNTWEWDGVAWQLRHPRSVPSVSTLGAAMAYDAARQRVILLGTFSSTPATAWEWDGSNWAERVFATAPSPRDAYGLAYDSVRRRLVLFGGRGQDGHGQAVLYDTTWEWDGISWREIPTPEKPSPRGAFGMTYDPRRGKVVLYGGGNLTDFFYDTWEYDGTTWMQRATSGPPRSFYTRMVYDVARERVVLFGGDGDAVDPAIAYTWEWDGSQWAEIAAVSEPPPRLEAPLVYDIVRRQVVLFGGWVDTNLLTPPLNDTWTRSGSTWLERPRGGSPISPSPRSRHAMVYEPRRATAALFGGRDGSGSCLDDTWVWSGSSWQRPAATPSPPARAEHAMAYDAERDRTVLFGGSDGTGRLLDDTWEWDGMAWRAVEAAGPPARKGHAMVYDAARKQVLLLGGTAGGNALADQWSWDGARWTELVPAVRPPPRTDFAMTYDPVRSVVALFGGRDASAAMRDLWEWDGVVWRDRTPSAAFAPAARSGHTLVYDAAQRRVVLFGGHSDAAGLSDVWTWDGTAWAAQSPVTSPRPRQHHATVSDSVRRTLMTFGGEDSGGPIGDLWFFALGDPSVHREDCRTGFDGDGDGLIGCADPDCDAACARCGDGVCGAFETCSTCSADCGACQLCGDLQCDAGESCASCPGDCGACPRREP